MKAVPRTTPMATGRPGLMPSRQKVSEPAASDRRLDVVLLAGGHAARRDEEVVRRRDAAASASATASRRSGRMPPIRHRAAEPAQQGDEHEAVGVVERRRRRGSPGETTSLPVENTATCEARRDGDVREAERAERARDPRGPRRRPASSAIAPLREVLAREPPVGAGLQARGQHDAVALEARVLLHEHRVEPGRHGRSGEDAHRVARRRTGEGSRRPPRGRPAEERSRPGGEIGGPHRVAVHRRIVEGRQVDGRQDALRQHASVRLRRAERVRSPSPVPAARR